MEPTKKLSTEAYKGVRDFYPEDMFIQNYIFGIIRKTVESFGYSEYNASVLEPAELYRSKTSDEIVNEQTYTFTDRGDREVTLRPEMTPTVARMIAGRRRDIAFPARWYSIPNCFRYEKPQRGRLREFWQLNVDMFGAKGIEADAEIILLAYRIMIDLGAKPEDFEIAISRRDLHSYILKEIGISLSTEQEKKWIRLLDKQSKLSKEDFEVGALEIFGEENYKKLENNIGKDKSENRKKIVERFFNENKLNDFIEFLKKAGVDERCIVPDQDIVRGFDYYTGIVFEVRDTNPINKRSLFGGGRFDNLTELFDNEPIPAVGFGMGDVTVHDFLEVRNLLPEYKATSRLFIATTDESKNVDAQILAQKLRMVGIPATANVTNKKIGDQIKTADKLKIPFVLVLGDEEIKTKSYKVKELKTGVETVVSEDALADVLR